MFCVGLVRDMLEPRFANVLCYWLWCRLLALVSHAGRISDLLTRATLIFLLLEGVEAAFMSSGLAMELGGELETEDETEDGTELELVEEKSADVENVVGRDDDVTTDGRDEMALDGEAAPAAPS
jgi:hypothetical protein